MKILIDTSVLVRTAHPGSTDHQAAVDAIAELPGKRFEGFLVPQIFYEYWVVATRPESQNGLGMTAQATTLELAQLASFFHVLRDERSIFERWQQIVTDHDVRGKNAHDARLVAAMLRHAISHLLTLNPKDFRRFTGITVLTPHELLDAKR